MKIVSVTFEGNRAYPDSRLHRLMVCRPSSFLQRRYYRDELFEDDLESLTLFYHRQGYLEARITGHSVRADSLENEMHIHIDVAEGERTRVEGVAILGNRFYTDRFLLEKIHIQSGEPFLQKEVEEAQLVILKSYADRGFLDAEVKTDLHVNREMHSIIIDFTITEGVQYTIGDITISGLLKTKPGVIEREFEFDRGEIVNYSSLLTSQRRLYLTGLFSSVFLYPQSSASGDSTEKDILVELKEHKSIEIGTSIGYGSVDRLRGKFEVTNRNIMGTARKFGLAGRISFIYRALELSFTDPWTFGTRWQTDIVLSTDFEEEPGYDLNSTGGRMAVGRRFFDHSGITLTYRHEKVTLVSIRVAEIPDDRESSLRSLTLTITNDTRDNMFNPLRGRYVEWSNELGGSFTEHMDGFVRTLVVLKYFHSLNRLSVLASAMTIGGMYSREGIQSIPLSERFYTGGPNSVRGMEYRRAGPIDSDRLPRGGRLKVVWNIVELRRILYKMIGGTLFCDAGNVWTDPGDFSLRDLRVTPGIGLRVNTPVGLVRLDCGFNPFMEEGESVVQFYFSMGQAF
jgi:outer membrane protein insertion porin family